MFQDALQRATVQTGESLDALSRETPILVVFLRHCGCPFTREAVADLRAQQEQIRQTGARLVLVHMSEETKAGPLFQQGGLGEVLRISDPTQDLYRAFELKRGSYWQVAGPRVWWRGLKAVLSGHGFGAPDADVAQLPGAFLIHEGKILKAFRANSSSDRPLYGELAQCPLTRDDSQ